MRSLIPIVLGAAGFWLAAPAPSAPLQCAGAEAREASSWSPWECRLEAPPGPAPAGSASGGRQAYQARLRFEFSAPGRAQEVAYAAWDGAAGLGQGGRQAFVVRRFFPPAADGQPLLWTWSSVCETPPACSALEGTGEVLVRPYEGENRLRRLGPLGRQVRQWREESGAARRWASLRQVSGGPFVWVADSPWAGPMLASDAEWASYLDDRAARGISVIQVGLAPGWAGAVDAAGRAPFVRIPGCSTRETVAPTPCDLPAPEFWRGFEAKVAAANERGLVVLVAGLMEPRSEHPAGNGPQNYPAPEEAASFARWLAARLAGSFVVLSPGFDSPPIVKKGQNLQDLVGRELASAAPRLLLTNHWATIDLAPIAAQHGAAWLGIEMFQSGHNDGNLPLLLRRAREMAALISGAAPSAPPAAATFAASQKPVVNGEAVYDHGGAPKPAFGDAAARRAAYLSWLSGAAGHSFGTGGIWDWGLCGRPANDPRNPCKYQMPEGWRAPLEAMRQPSAGHMAAFAELLASLGGAELDAAEQGRILHQVRAEPGRTAVLARGAASLLAYLPENAGIDLRLPSRVGEPTYLPQAALVFDPRQGVFAPLEAERIHCRPPRYATDRCRFANPLFSREDPAAGDALVLVPRRSDSGLQVFAGRLAAGEPWGIWARPPGEGQEWGAPVPVFAAAGVAARAPAAAGGGKSFLIAWQAEAGEAARRGIFARRLDEAGRAAGAVLRISPEGSRAVLEPAVAVGEDGSAVVVWKSVEPASGEGEIWARGLSREGEAGPALRLAGGDGRDAAQPKVTIGRDGRVRVAWVEREDGDGMASLRMRTFKGGSLAAEGPAQRLAGGQAPQLWLLALRSDEGGRVEAEYERRFGATGAGTFVVEAAPGGEGPVDEIRLEPPYEN